MICHICNRPIKDYEKFCPVCGTENKAYYKNNDSDSLIDDSHAILAFSFALIAMISFPFPYFSLPTSILGIIFSLIGMKNKRKYYMCVFGLTNSIVMFIVSAYYLINQLFIK